MAVKGSSNILYVNNITAIIEDILKCIGYAHSKDNIDYVLSLISKNEIKDFRTAHPSKVFACLSSRILRTNPDIIFPSWIYKHELLDDDCLHMLITRLKRRDLKATTKIISQLAWQAFDMNENRGDIENISHAINTVIKIYQLGHWKEPFNCPVEFSYKKQFKDS